eukprot:TRINITY_DN437_c2_g2_i2.p1 TRINITY_DN437_c2_g2~~TRINITY_DN437_c2_g2_i2.p1  ORF type:complete len:139 (+),score=12.93 TRINITY_DN437_c2_g2_i2:69-485(+)
MTWQEDKQIKISNYMFYAGFALLPWLWVVSAIFFRHVYKQEHCPPVIKRSMYTLSLLPPPLSLSLYRHIPSLSLLCSALPRSKIDHLSLFFIIDFKQGLLYALIIFTVFTIWYALFIYRRVAWGGTGRALAFNYPFVY